MTTYINASCHCGLNSFRVAFETTSPPAEDQFCHCSTCRHTSGQLAAHYVEIHGVPFAHSHEASSRSASRNAFREEHHPHDGNGNGNGNGASTNSSLLSPPIQIQVIAPEVPFDLSNTTQYKTYSPDVTRYFCDSCSAHLFWVRNKSPQEKLWAVAAGALEETDGVMKTTSHIWVGDTLDGGLADHLRVIDGIPLARCGESLGSKQLPIGWKATPNTGNNTDPEFLHAHCHCEAVSFAITRPSEASFSPSAPYPDLLHASKTTLLSKLANLQDEKWWLRPENSEPPTKYLAGHCMCGFCRLSSGFEVQSWAFIPLANIVTSHSHAPICLDTEERRPTGLKQYLTSPGKYREFCGTCGATVFAWGADYPDLVSVSVGLFDEKTVGVRAESWLDWHKHRVAFQEKALDPSLAKGLEESLKSST